MLKLDVQGFEYEALIGCESMLRISLGVLRCRSWNFILGETASR